MQTGMYHSFSERLFAIKNSLLVYSHCFWNEICSDSKNTFQESQVSDFILLLGKAGLLHWPLSGSWKYPLDTSHNPRQTSSGNLQERKDGSTFKGEDKYLTVKTTKKKNKGLLPAVKQLLLSHWLQHTEKWWGLDWIQQSKVRETNSRTAGANSLAGSCLCTCKYSGSVYMHPSGHGSHVTQM